ncbi:MAG: ABC transporter ATP-binding protein [Desulfobacterales bacterium]|jgi:ABC-type multidrug transport system fused ATPase/permease subunit
MIQLGANAVAQAAALIVNALIIRYAFDQLLSDALLLHRHLVWIGLGMTGMAAAAGGLQYGERIIAEKLGQSYVHGLRMRLFRHITRMHPRDLQRRRRGAVMLKFVGDLNAVRRWVSLGLVRLVVSGAILCGTLSILCLIDPILSFCVGLLIVSGVLINIRIGGGLKKAVSESRRRRSQMSANINEKIAHMGVVQVFGRTESELRRIRRQSNGLRSALIDRAAGIGAIRAVTHGGTVAAMAVVLTMGLLRIKTGDTSPGAVAAAMAVLGFLLPALRNLGRVYEYFQDYQVSKKNLDQFLATRASLKARAGRPDLPSGPGRLVFENVNVKGIIRRLSAEIEPGSTVVLTGPNGSGKSTLIGLAARLIDADRGRVLIDGRDIVTSSLPSVHQAVGVVSPDLPLLAGSLEMNIRYRCPHCSSAALEWVLQLCGIGDIAGNRPLCRFRVHEGGRNLSAGQRQRVMLARAILGSPRILLLDEVDAHLDPASRRILDHVIRSYPGTVLWATHRSDALTLSTAAWLMKRGRLYHAENGVPVLSMAG